MMLLLIDDDPDFRKVARSYLLRLLPDVEVVDYDPVQRGKPGPGFNWSEFNVLLLDYNLGQGEDGFAWMQEYYSAPGFPPTVILTGEGNEYIAARAIKLGAANYLNKIDLTPRRLAEVVLEATLYTPEQAAAQARDQAKAEHVIEELQEQSEPRARSSTELGYKVVRKIGEGAMAKVYLAERETDQLTVVLKILEMTDAMSESAVIRFIQEAELIVPLTSRHVARIYDYGLTNDYGFIAMEFFSRGDLKQRLELQLPSRMALHYMTQVASGLDAIHRVGVVHRDLKPANIMFRSDDSLALADFGIAKRLDTPLDITTLGKILGTPHYMSPEQAGSNKIDQRADIYSAGIMLFEMLTGKRPYNAHSAAALIYQHLSAPIPQLPPDLGSLQPIIEKCLAKDPAARYQSAAELAAALDAART